MAMGLLLRPGLFGDEIQQGSELVGIQFLTMTIIRGVVAAASESGVEGKHVLRTHRCRSGPIPAATEQTRKA